MLLDTLGELSGLLSLGAMWVLFASGMPFGAGFQLVPRRAVRRMLELSEPEGKVVYDLFWLWQVAVRSSGVPPRRLHRNRSGSAEVLVDKKRSKEKGPTEYGQGH